MTPTSHILSFITPGDFFLGLVVERLLGSLIRLVGLHLTTDTIDLSSFLESQVVRGVVGGDSCLGLNCLVSE